MADTKPEAPTVIPPRLDPLANSHAYDAVEADLRDAVIAVFEAMLRPHERTVNAYGMPHRSDFETIERFVKSDGLAMERANAEPYMAELFRGWRARNPRRGTHFLKFYLQLLYPGQWAVTQLWQDPEQPYPAGANEAEAPGKFLTSRIRVSLQIDDPEELGKMVGSFRAVLPARFVLELTLRSAFASTLHMASAVSLSAHQRFTGTAAPL